MGKLWQKKELTLDKEIEKFEVGTDYHYDLYLAPFDVYGTAAHVKMLKKIGILSENELSIILKALKEILEEIERDEFRIEISDEDVHTKIENLIIERYGDVGKKIHTARSRNDQVLVDTRLYSKKALIEIAQAVLNLCETILEFAKKNEFVPMPGYTHMQIAMPSSVGLWASSFVENFLDELEILSAVYDYNDMNPLGSGAAYGVSFPIDREYTTSLLGFSRLQKNVLYCANSRGKIEAYILSTLTGFALILNRLATDILMFTMKEFQYFYFSEKVSTGSSIMPQKKNLDVMELVRARSHTQLAHEFHLKSLLSNLPSGYNRDYQESKKLLIDSIENLKSMLNVTRIVFNNMEVNKERLIDAHPPEIYATDAAYRLVKKGVPFREAYRKIGRNLEELTKEDPIENIKEKTHIGATGNLPWNDYSIRITKQRENWKKNLELFSEALQDLLEIKESK